MSVAEQFERMIAGFPAPVQELARAVRSKIYQILPQVTEVVWERQKIAGYGTGPKKMSEHYHWIQPAKQHVTLGFNYGVDLPDPQGILVGIGKNFRHFKVRTLSDLARADLIALMSAAPTHRVPPLKKDA